MTSKFVITLMIAPYLSGCLTNQNDPSGKVSTKVKNAIDTTFSYQPEQYQEQAIDTILDRSSYLNLTIKHYSLMDKGFNVPVDYGTRQVDLIHFRDFAVDINLWEEGELIYAETIQKEDFEGKIEDKDFLSTAIFSFADLAWYDQETGEVKIECMISMIESDYAHIFMLTIDRERNKSVELIEIT